MMRRGVIGPSLLLAAFGVGAIAGACSSGSGGGSNRGKSLFQGDGGLLTFDAAATGLHLDPPSVSLNLDPGSPAPDPVQFTLTGASGEKVRWRLSNPSLGTIDQNGLFVPSGQIGGEGDVEAIVGNAGAKAHIVVTVNHVQNGGDTAVVTDPGVGGLGGVGGDGEGGKVTDALRGVLDGAPAADAGLKILYPYDQTVFPLGILPPLLQWSPGGSGNFEGIYIHLSAPPYYDYKGYFSKPPLVGNGNFVRHPIPKSVWDSATKSAAGGNLTLEVVLAAGGKAYGPLRHTYPIALAPFNGTVYYQAYATDLAQNWDPELTVGGDRFGGATLSIKVGATAPELVAGTTTDNKEGCRVCHSVSAYGDRMVVQHGDDYPQTSSYDLKNGNREATPYTAGTVGWAGLYPDGSIGLANSIDVTGSNSNDGDTALYDMTNGNVIPSPGLAEFATRIALPAFSPDGKHAAFTLYEGPSTQQVGPADSRKLVVMDFDLPTNTFSNPRRLWQSPANDQRPSFVTFFPSSDAVVFQRRWKGDNDDELSTWYGSRGELWWADLATQTATPLDRLNGIGADGQSYLPTGPDNHADDQRLNYEPSISPVASGGYAWVVFMSRRMYGNVAVSDPWHSDPRNYDLKKDITTKKLWMAALDLNPQPGKDPSHPAFYIPGQEIHGVNSRPFFALQPCLTDRGTCTTGVDCCTGFCRDGYCSPPPVHDCSQIDEKCTQTSDCCDSRSQCIGGFCAVFIQ